MDFSLTPEWPAHVWQRFGPWEVGRYPSPTNTKCVRFNALLSLVNVEGVSALTQRSMKIAPAGPEEPGTCTAPRVSQTHA